MRRSGALHLTIALFITLLGYAVLSSAGRLEASDRTPWRSTEGVFLELMNEVAFEEIPYRILGNRDCHFREITTRQYGKAKLSHESCAVDTGYGSMSQSGYLQRTGSSVWGKVDSGYILLATPRRNSALLITNTTSNGSYVAFLPDVEPYLSSKPSKDGTIAHALKIDGLQTLKRSDGSSLQIRYDSLAFSTNGLWAIADSPGFGMTRINMTTGEVLLFGPAVSYNKGLNVGWQTAISTDGNFAAIYSYSFNIFRIYSLNRCTEGCKFIDVNDFVRSSVDGYRHSSNIKFAGNGVLDFYITGYDQTNTQHIGHYLLSSEGFIKEEFKYLGLGDSFSSGEGAYGYKSFTDAGDNKCHVSFRSYPFLIGASLGYDRYESVACSGAKQEDTINESLDYEGQADKLKREDRSEESIELIKQNYLPGYLAQIEFLRRYKPEAVTISISGNDIGFGDIIARCIMPDTCYKTYNSRKGLMQVVDQQFDSLVNTYTQLSGSSPKTRIYALGYPKIAFPGDNCEPNVRLNKEELQFANDLVHYFNEVIKQAAEKAGVFYVDVENTFTGHRLCEPIQHWNIAVNGLTAGNDNPGFLDGPVGNESYHPNALGHRLYAEAIKEKTSNLTARMPSKQSNKALQTDHDSSDLLKDMEKPDDTVPLTFYDPDSSESMFFVGEESTVNPTNKLEPESTASVWLYSVPTKLGDFKINSSGLLNVDVVVPETISNGYHTLHIFGTNISGEPVDIYKTVYVAASRDDYDGDGILNQNERCQFGEPSGVDRDNDSIDDACDGYVAKYNEQRSNDSSMSNSQEGHKNSDQNKQTTTSDLGTEISYNTETLQQRQNSNDKPKPVVLTANTSTNQTSEVKNTPDEHFANINYSFIIFVISVVLLFLILIYKIYA